MSGRILLRFSGILPVWLEIGSDFRRDRGKLELFDCPLFLFFIKDMLIVEP